MWLRFYKLLKVNLEKMSLFQPSTMLMKTNPLNPSVHDVDENKWSYLRMKGRPRDAQNPRTGALTSLESGYNPLLPLLDLGLSC
jgi:hypothetical protein